MYATIRRYNVKREQIAELTSNINTNFLPQITEIAGFVSYDVLNTGGRMATVSVFETREGANESTRRASEFVKKNLASLHLAAPELFEGDVAVHQTAAQHLTPAFAK